MDTNTLRNTLMPFRGGSAITQLFGDRPEIYKLYGLQGHEGIDLVPLSADWNIRSMEDGIVTQDIDSSRSGAYGVYVVIWNKTTQRAWWYAHCTRNYVSLGQTIKKGQPIALMGTTGNSTGPHLHLGCRISDKNGYPLNKNNGYNGFVNPLPFIFQLNQTTTSNNNRTSKANTNTSQNNKTIKQNPQNSGNSQRYNNENITTGRSYTSPYDNENHPYNNQKSNYRKVSPYNNKTHPYNNQGGGGIDSNMGATILADYEDIVGNLSNFIDSTTEHMASEFRKLQNSHYGSKKWQSARDVLGFIDDLINERNEKEKEISNFKSLVKKLTVKTR